MSRTKRPFQRKLGFEGLEDRRLLTGNVTSKVASSNLTLTGDSQNNAITITQMGANTYCISGQNGTTINGLSKITVTGVKNNVTVNFQNGNDTLVLTNATFPADVTVTMGKGTDLVQVGFSNDREFGTGSVSVHHNLNITLGNGACDEVEESDLFVGHDQNIKLGDGNYDQVLLGESGEVESYTSEFVVSVAHDFNVTLGNGNGDFVNLADLDVSFVDGGTPTIAGRAGFSGNPSADQAPSGGESVAVGHDLNITFGKGNDDSLTISNEIDLEDGSELVGAAINDVSLVTVGHDCKITMGNGNDDNVSFNFSVFFDDGGEGDGGDNASPALVTPNQVEETPSIVDGTFLAVGHDLTITLGNGNFDSVVPGGEEEGGNVGEGETYNNEPLITVGHDANVKLGSGQGDTIGGEGAVTEIADVVKPAIFEEEVYFAVVVNHDFNITLGAGKGDEVDLIDTLVGHNLSITEGNGACDSVFLGGVEIGANLAVTTGNGGDEVDLEYVEAFQANITTGSGKDSVFIGDGSDFAKLYASLGAGNDCLDIDTSVYVSQNANLDGGAGSNSFFGGGPTGPGKVMKSHF